MGAWGDYLAPCFAGTTAQRDHLIYPFIIVQYTHMFSCSGFLALILGSQWDCQQ